MKEILKPIYEMITGEYILFENVIYNYVALGIIGIIAFVVAWNSVGKLYDSGIITGKISGSIIHWIIRLIAFIICFYIFASIIWLVKNIIIILIISGILTICYVLYKKASEKKKMYNNYLEKEFQEIQNKMSASIQIEKRDIAIKLSEKGLLNSGVVFEMENNLIISKINDALIKISDILSNANKEFNNKLSKRENINYIDKLSKNICDIINRYYDDMKKKSENLNNCELGGTINLWCESLKQNVNGKVKDIFQKMTWIDSGRRIEKIVWLGIILSVISIVEGAISIYLSIK